MRGKYVAFAPLRDDDDDDDDADWQTRDDEFVNTLVAFNECIILVVFA
jgi:hypothetical protein